MLWLSRHRTLDVSKLEMLRGVTMRGQDATYDYLLVRASSISVVSGTADHFAIAVHPWMQLCLVICSRRSMPRRSSRLNWSGFSTSPSDVGQCDRRQHRQPEGERGRVAAML